MAHHQQVKYQQVHSIVPSYANTQQLTMKACILKTYIAFVTMLDLSLHIFENLAFTAKTSLLLCVPLLTGNFILMKNRQTI